MEYLVPIGIFAGLGLLAGVLLTMASKFFAVKTDERVEQINEALPQVNCGACGFSGCSDYANAVVNSGAECNLCKAGGAAVAAKIGEIMGQSVTAKEPEVAFVRCGGNCNITEHKYEFDGVQSCAACNRFYNGSKYCTSGCLGYGDCVKVCPHNAIAIVNGIAVVDKAKCVGCGLCAKACPNSLISVRRISQKVEVCCSSKDIGRITRQLCSNGCIGCKLCEKACPFEAVKVVDNHAVIDYTKCKNCGKCVAACKMGAIRKINQQ